MTDLAVTAALDHLDAWRLALRAENEAPGTVIRCVDCTRYLRWCDHSDKPPMSRASLNQWIAEVLETGSAWHARIRHRRSAAHRWLAAGGSESGLMAIAGWTRTDVLVRYTHVRASERAAAEARRLDLATSDRPTSPSVGVERRSPTR